MFLRRRNIIAYYGENYAGDNWLMRQIDLFKKDLCAMLGSSKLSTLEKSSLSHGAGLMCDS